MTRIYYSAQLEINQSYRLDKFASNHLLKVLRLKSGSVFTLFNNTGTEFPATLETDNKTAIAHINDAIVTDNESPLKIHLYQGVSKGDRMDFVVQKSTELGVIDITPVICERTVVNLKGDRLEKKIQHWQNIAISACEQSGRNIIPNVHKMISFTDCINTSHTGLKLSLNPMSEQKLSQISPDNSALSLLIGPEGGLSDTEIQRCAETGFHTVQLGPRVLRTETAALSAISAAQLLWGDFT